MDIVMGLDLNLSMILYVKLEFLNRVSKLLYIMNPYIFKKFQWRGQTKNLWNWDLLINYRKT